MAIGKCMHGLPQAGISVNQFLKKRLAKYDYYKVPHTISLWKHHTHLMKFTLVFDNVGIKYVNKKDAGHLVNVLKDCYKIEIDWTGRLNCVASKMNHIYFLET
ncbi:hypothetical protein ACHAXS_013060 [Conticribra weissflogii]